ncbi:hypothetical protein [Lacinutrix jangbogonensis]|uniref:hypothetical protein n=1 Tax=Lacinutrix jangbogonensis TaxID=1469557 RepID=UPI00053EEB43|nr:hypothetical protein [Lacinutrix jangbogonensis]
MNKKYFLIALLFNILVYAQETKTFHLNEQFYVHGDAISIGNNILSKHKKKAFNTINIVNDQINMKYVDVDNDNSTFSSSSANLELLKNNNKIVYAGLYWSAIYGYKKGVKRKRGNKIFYIGKGKRDSIFNIIKFKTPNGDYKSVLGDVLFDGFENEKFKESSPYVCYADVTNLIDNNNINGAYTVANIKATQGFTSGGSSAGWVLYVVYEKPKDNPKYITTYHGLAVLEKNKPLDIALNQFITAREGFIDASITMAALEGDSRLKQDQSLVFNPQDSTYIPLSNKIRHEKNFFNSTITTKDNELFINRNPNSRNTLGFDLAQIKVPNENNKIIGKNTTEATLRFNTKSDRFYLFFTAFETEISQDFYDLQQNKEDLIPIDLNTKLNNESIVNTDNEMSSSKVLASSDDKELVINNPEPKTTPSIDASKLENETILEQDKYEDDNVVVSNEEIIDEVNPLIPEDFESLIIDINNSEGMESSELRRGYYVITNVFSKKYLADRWNALLLKKGYQTEVFINPKNNWYYISVFNTEDIYVALKERSRLDALDYLEGIWVFKVNIDSPTI